MYQVLLIVLISLFSSALSEFLSWLVVYRQPDYQRLKKSIENLQEKIAKRKEENAATQPNTATTGKINKPAKDKKLSHLDSQLAILNKSFASTKLKAMGITAVSLIGVFALLNRLFDGQIVARLPFEPFGFVKNFTHRGLTGAGTFDSGMMFIYLLCNIALRPAVQRFTGFQPPAQQANPFNMDMNAAS